MKITEYFVQARLICIYFHVVKTVMNQAILSGRPNGLPQIAAALAPDLAISLLRSADNFLARALPPARANSVTVMLFGGLGIN